MPDHQEPPPQPTIEHQIALYALKLKIIARSHPRRVRAFSLCLICALIFLFSRHYLWVHIPIWIQSLSHRIFIYAQSRPIFERILHVLFNAVPDIAFTLLAISGLAYLVPERHIKSLENKPFVRAFLIILFLGVGVSAIIVNGVKSENQEYKDEQHEKTLNLVLTNVTNIQGALSSKSVQMTEGERRRHLLDSLRDEYVLKQNNVDPEIVAGNKMPPDDWLNRRLGELKENWQIHTPPVPGVIAKSPQPLITIVSNPTQIPTKAGEDALANLQLSIDSAVAKTVRVGQESAIYSVFPNDSVKQRAVENELWSQLEENDKKNVLDPLALPSNNKNLGMPLKYPNISQANLDKFKDGTYALYFMVHIETLKGKTLLDSCFYVDNKNQLQYCREHNGP